MFSLEIEYFILIVNGNLQIKLSEKWSKSPEIAENISFTINAN